MKKGQIRAIATCIFKKNDSILVCEGFDEFNHEYYYRPIGGGIEYGETSSNALKREVIEEIGAKITNVKLLGAMQIPLPNLTINKIKRRGFNYARITKSLI
ncbi:NUDIX domain-containing protein [Sutcliffiella cohnii]